MVMGLHVPAGILRPEAAAPAGYDFPEFSHAQFLQ
jgi:hypothetical protein